MKVTYLVFLALLSTPLTLMAEGNTAAPSPIEAYHSWTQISLLLCTITEKTEQLSAETDTPIEPEKSLSTCIKKHSDEAKAELNSAIKTLKNNNTQEALKNYHVAFITALKGIEPGFDERKITYSQRQQMLTDKVNEAWARFDIENN